MKKNREDIKKLVSSFLKYDRQMSYLYAIILTGGKYASK